MTTEKITVTIDPLARSVRITRDSLRVLGIDAHYARVEQDEDGGLHLWCAFGEDTEEAYEADMADSDCALDTLASVAVDLVWLHWGGLHRPETEIRTEIR